MIRNVKKKGRVRHLPPHAVVGGMRMEDLAEVRWSAEVDGGVCVKDILIFYPFTGVSPLL